ncbi:hypothetical protein NG796_14800 [Laspinema sp. A4]|nr:hypothetical protein [Laspinema sp. D2d]MCT7984566.1 hypothetical protein [Laspinema sp. D2d]
MHRQSSDSDRKRLDSRRESETGNEHSCAFTESENCKQRDRCQSTLAQLESIWPLCACGCGARLTVPESYLKNNASINTIQKYWKQYTYKKNHHPRCKSTPWNSKLAALEELRPLCACGCGEKLEIPNQAKKTSVEYIQRYWEKHPTKQNHYKLTTLADKLTELEYCRPFCACGCGEQLDIPIHLLSRKTPSTVVGINSHWKRHPYKKGHGQWDKRTEKFLANAEFLSADTLGLIYGTLLGDGCITYPNQYSRFPRLSWTHGESQREWMEYKASRLAALQPQIRMAPNQGYGYLSVCCQTRCHPQLPAVFESVRPQGRKKRVSHEWLKQITPEGLAWFYMDDGSLSISQGSPSIQLHTEGYSVEENQLIADWLKDCGYPAKIMFYTSKKDDGSKTYPYIRLNADTTRKFVDELQPYSIPSMDYKFGEGRICRNGRSASSLRY